MCKVAKPRENVKFSEVAVVRGCRRRSHFQSFLSNLVSPGRHWRGTIWSSSREEEVSLAKEVVFWFSSPSPHNNAGQWTFQKLICAALSAASCCETFAEKLRQQTFSWFSCNTDKAQCGFETRFQLWGHLDEVSKDHFCADIKFSSRVALFQTNWVHNGTSKVSGGGQKTLRLQLSLNKTRQTT